MADSTRQRDPSMKLRGVALPRLKGVSKAQGARRFNVTVERDVIVYASTVEEAQQKALAYLRTAVEPPADRKMHIVDVEELPERDERGPIIDGSPARETRT